MASCRFRPSLSPPGGLAAALLSALPFGRHTRVSMPRRHMRLRLLFAAALLVPLLLSVPALAENAFQRGARHLGDDVTGTFFSWPMLLLLGGGGLAGALHPLDSDVASHFARGRNLGRADDVADYVAKFYVLDPAALLIYGAGKLAKDDEVALTGEVLLESLLFAQGVTGLVKRAAGRTRPDGGGFSFPSGHASNAFAVATALEVLHGPALGLPAYAAAAFIAFARIDSNSHYLSDAIMGAAVGSAVAWGVAAAHRRRMPSFAIIPVVREGTLGVGIWRLF